MAQGESCEEATKAAILGKDGVKSSNFYKEGGGERTTSVGCPTPLARSLASPAAVGARCGDSVKSFLIVVRSYA